MKIGNLKSAFASKMRSFKEKRNDDRRDDQYDDIENIDIALGDLGKG